jgi:hypothetical protein
MTPDFSCAAAGRDVTYLEYCAGKASDYIRPRVDVSRVQLFDYEGDILNLPRLVLSRGEENREQLAALSGTLATAIGEDAQDKYLRAASCAFAWFWEDLRVSVLIAGNARKVTTPLSRLSGIVDPARAPSQWIERLKEAVVQQEGDRIVNRSSLVRSNAILILPHPGTDEVGAAKVKLLVPRSALGAEQAAAPKKKRLRNFQKTGC